MDEVNDTMMHAGLPPVIFQDAYYSNEKDVPDRPREYAGREFKLQSNTLPYLPPFDPTGKDPANFGEQKPILVNKKEEASKAKLRSQRCDLRNWEIAKAPPTFEEVEEWLGEESARTAPLKTPSKCETAASP